MQVLGMEAVESQKNQMNNSLELIRLGQDAAYKGAMIKQMSEKTKLDAKIATDEAEKVKLQHQAAKMDFIAAALKEASKQPDPKKYLVGVLGIQGNTFMDVLANKEMMEQLGNIQPSTEATKDLAQAEDYTAGANYKKAFTGLIQGQGPGGNTEGGPGGPNAASAGVLQGMRPLGVTLNESGGSINYGDPQIDIDKASTIKRNSVLEDMKANAAPAIGMIDTLEKMWGKAFEKNPKTGVDIGQGVSEWVGAKTMNDTAAANYLTTMDAFLAKTVRALGEKGVLTEKDIGRIAKAMPKNFTSQDLAKANFATIRSIMTSGIQEYIKMGPAVGNTRMGWGNNAGSSALQGDVPSNQEGSPDDPMGLLQ